MIVVFGVYFYFKGIVKRELYRVMLRSIILEGGIGMNLVEGKVRRF